VRLVLLTIALLQSGCVEQSWNSPYPKQDAGSSILYSSFSERPKHLDPARSYSATEYTFIGQVYEPPLQYHYLKRPYELVTLTASKMPQPHYYNARNEQVDEDAPDLAFSVYDISIKPDIYYQPHPALAKSMSGKDAGGLLYHNLTEQDLEDIYSLSDFPETGTRELVAADYVYQIKRLAHPRVYSPILGVMSEYITGLADYAKELEKAYDAQLERDSKDLYLDLTKYPLSGVKVVDRYTYRITIKGKYPQLLYWLAMPFFSPMPPEAIQFYSQPGMEERNLTLDWYPLGSGPYMLSVNDPNRQMVLERNPNFHGETYPAEGEAGDEQLGLLRDAGKDLPFIERIIFSLEKETIPYWSKFLQGYYDASAISSDSFDQAVRIAGQGEVSLTDDMKQKGIQLQTAINASTFYMGFNMLDPVLGGYTESSRKLRQAISIALDYEEYISIFSNGRGIPAQGPIPPGIFGFRDGQGGINPYMYEWVDGKEKRKSIEHAKQLLVDAGYAEGMDASTGKPLVLHLDITASGPDDKARLAWYRKQLAKLNVQLVIRNTDYNRFRDKMRSGNAQIFTWGWNADYPDPENFLFLLYGPNSKVKFHGENAANYMNPEFDRLFEQMKTMENSPERQRIIDQMIEVVRRDSPWVWGLHPKKFSLFHSWYENVKPNLMANNSMKYRQINAAQRSEMQAAWNKPVIWPLGLVSVLLVLLILPAVLAYLRSEKQPSFGVIQQQKKGEV